MTERSDPLVYLPGMQVLDSDIPEQVLHAFRTYAPSAYTAADVRRALARAHRTPADFAALLSPAAAPLLEQLAKAAQAETKLHFGNSTYLFTPLYLSNYCENHCVYCGFHCHNHIKRKRLDESEIERELRAIAKSGLEEILLLTGESRQMSDVGYIGAACRLARKYFKLVGLEVYPMNTDEYAYLHACGADYITVFQETYDLPVYEALHLQGHKRVFPYRISAQERALQGGMRGVGFAALLGLSDFRRDAYATGMHAYLIQRKYPSAEIAFSCPRLRPIAGQQNDYPHALTEAQLLQVIAAYRLFLPFANITISTRECARFRDHIIQIAATKISAGVCTGVGGHEAEDAADAQFEIADNRSVADIHAAILGMGLQPVTNDYVYV